MLQWPTNLGGQELEDSSLGGHASRRAQTPHALRFAGRQDPSPSMNFLNVRIDEGLMS